MQKGLIETRRFLRFYFVYYYLLINQFYEDRYNQKDY